jgi:hypothetical protein
LAPKTTAFSQRPCRFSFILALFAFHHGTLQWGRKPSPDLVSWMNTSVSRRT